MKTILKETPTSALHVSNVTTVEVDPYHLQIKGIVDGLY